MLTIESIPEERFGAQPVVKGAPVENEQALQNIRDSVRFDVPIFAKEKPNGGAAIFVAAGPSLRQYLPELKRRHDAGEVLITCNHTYDYLQEHGIVCDMCLLIDPRPENKDCVTRPQAKTIFYVAAVCDPGLFENLLALHANVVKVMVAYGMDDERDIDLQKELYKRPSEDFLVGGTMTPLRAMPFAVMLGLSKLEFYGFDSCYMSEEPKVLRGEPRFDEIFASNGGISYTDVDSNEEYVIDEPDDGGFFYAYKKKRPENITVVLTSDGRRWLTTPGLGNQARQICKWVDRIEGALDVTIHGDSLSSNLLRIHRENIARARAQVGDRRWSDGYAEQQREMHAHGAYGVWGDHDLELVSRTLCSIYCAVNSNLERDDKSVQRPITLLDYGAGNGALGRSVEALFSGVKVTNYDPFHPLWRDAPEPGIHDVTTCCDVLEHVEVQCVDNTLRYIAEHTRYAAYFSIALSEAKKTLPNGKNAHITLKTAQWWVDRISKYFVPKEGKANGEVLVLVCQKQDAKQQIASLREAA